MKRRAALPPVGRPRGAARGAGAPLSFDPGSGIERTFLQYWGLFCVLLAHYLRFHPGSSVFCRVSGTQDLAYYVDLSQRLWDIKQDLLRERR